MAMTLRLPEELDSRLEQLARERGVSWIATLTFLELNGVRVDMPVDAAFELVLAVTQGQIALDEIADALGRHSVPQ